MSRFIPKLYAAISRLKRRPAISLAINVAREMGEDNAGDMAGSIAYYAVLSIFPLLLGIIALLGLFLPSAMVREQIFQFVNQYLPGSSQLIERNINSIIELRGTLGLFSIGGLFWTGSNIFGSIGRVINQAWDISVYRPFYLRKLRDILIAIGASVIFFLSMAATAFSSIIPAIDLPVLDSLAIIVARVLGFILILIAVSMIYEFMPNTKTRWKCVWPGALIAAILLEIARTAFTIYLDTFATYDMVYGSITVVIVLLVWIYISAFIIILGAEFASEFHKIYHSSEARR